MHLINCEMQINWTVTLELSNASRAYHLHYCYYSQNQFEKFFSPALSIQQTITKHKNKRDDDDTPDKDVASRTDAILPILICLAFLGLI